MTDTVKAIILEKDTIKMLDKIEKHENWQVNDNNLKYTTLVKYCVLKCFTDLLTNK